MWLLRLVGQYADGLVKLGEDFLQPGVRLLHDEGGAILGLALLYLSGLHDVGVAPRVGVEPTDE